MHKPAHSTQSILIWSLLGIIIGLIILQWPGLSPLSTDTPLAKAAKKASYANAVAIAAPTVVSIQASHASPANDSPIHKLIKPAPSVPTPPNQGSGVIMDQQGHILTNYHVIAKASKITVTLYDGHKLQAKLVGADPDTDLAVITIKHSRHPNISFADPADIQVGDIVLAIGNPFGIGQTVTQGIISATGRDRVGLNTYENFIQTDAAINPGNSGGALINTLGQIVGINSATFTQSGSYQGIGFAIPIDMALKVVQQILKNGGVIRGWLGVEGVDLNKQMLQKIGLKDIRGVLITDVFKNGPADQAGLAVGDIITQINQTPIRDTRDVLDIIAQGKPGDKIRILGIRQRQSFMTQAILDQRPQESH